MAENVTEKLLKTRIQLRYDSLANWTANNPLLKKGEVAIAYLATSHTTTTPDNNTHPVLMKVGPGAFNTLPWMSALAADVYEWAKKNEVKIEVPEESGGNAVTNVEIKDGFLTFTKGTKFATKAELDAAIEAFGGDLSAITDNDHQYSFAITEGKLVITAVNYVNGKPGESAQVASLDFVTPEELTSVLTNYYTKGEADARFAPIDVDTGVHSVSLTGGTNNGTLKLTVDGQATDNIAVTGLDKIKVDNAGHADTAGNATHAETAGSADQAGVATKTVAPLTVTIGGETKSHFGDSETVVDIDTAIAAGVAEAKKYADDNDANTEYHVEYDSANKKIKLVAGADASKMEIPTDDFIKDGMISSVAISEDGKNLVITWNSDAGKDVTNIPLTELVDIMTGIDGTTITVNVSADDKISAEVKTGSLKDGHIASDAAIAKSKLATDVQTSLGKADNSLQLGAFDDAPGSMSAFGLINLILTKKDKQEAIADQNYSGATVVKGIAQDEHGVISVSTRTITPADIGAQPAGNYATAEQGSKADTALQAADKEALIGTTDDSSSTLSIEGTRKYAKELADENKLAIDAINNAETGILAQAKKDAGDKAAVVLGEAQKYADDKVAELAGEGNTTTVAALAERVSGLETAGHLTEVVAKDYDGEGKEKVSGLKVQNNNEIAIDDSVVFILDCNW